MKKRSIKIVLTAMVMCSALFIGACGQKEAAPAASSESSSTSATQYTTKEEVKAELDAGTENYVLLDLRKAADFEAGHITGAYSADVDPAISDSDDATSTANLKAAIAAATGSEEGSADSKYILICYSGKKYAEKGTELMTTMGIDGSSIYTLEGGNNGWADAGEEYTNLME